MIIYIDQSGKVEYTSQNTVVAFSNGKYKSVLIKATDKRKIQQAFREAEKPNMFVYKTFAALLYLLVEKENFSILEIKIDREYWGKEAIIKDHLLRIVRKQNNTNFDASKISFCLVGRSRTCHILAIAVLRGNKKADKIVTAKEILSLVL